MKLNEDSFAKKQYSGTGNLQTRISIHEKYSTNKQGFGSWIYAHYHIAPGAAVLELGCGTGGMWANQDGLIQACGKLVLSDFSEGMVAQAKQTLQAYPGIDYQVIDIQHIPYPADTFDVVIANMMLYHVPDLQQGLAEVRRVLKPGGTFYCATYGENGMMPSLYRLFASYGVVDQASHTFTLQNGASQLAHHFDEVHRHDYEDGLAVTEVDDLVAYLRSISGVTALANLPEETLKTVLTAAMVDGVIHLPKEYGMFVAR